MVFCSPTGSRCATPYVLSEESVPLAGAVVARDDLKGMALRRTARSRAHRLPRAGPLSQRHLVRETGDVHTASLRGRHGHGAHAAGPEARQRSTDRAGRREERDLRFQRRCDASPSRCSPRNGVCRAVFTVTPTAVPGPADPRVLGVHFLEFRYAAP